MPICNLCFTRLNEENKQPRNRYCKECYKLHTAGRSKLWREQNPEKDKIARDKNYEKSREKMTLCECGITYYNYKRTRHYETLKHKKNLNL